FPYRGGGVFRGNAGTLLVSRNAPKRVPGIGASPPARGRARHGSAGGAAHSPAPALPGLQHGTLLAAYHPSARCRRQGCRLRLGSKVRAFGDFFEPLAAL